MVKTSPPVTSVKVALPRSLWIIWLVSMLLLAIVGGTLLLFPTSAQNLWPWSLAPFNTRLLGAVYASAAVPLMGYLINPQGRYIPVLLPVFTCFTTYFLLVSIGYISFFLPRKAAAIWFFLYGADSVAGLYFCWTLRSLLKRKINASHWLRLYRLQSLILAVYGLALLLYPKGTGATWVWPLDGFHSQLYSGVLLSAALAMELLRDRASAIERLWFSGTQAFLGAMLAITTWLVDVQVNKLDWASPWPWIWQSIFLMFAGVGGWIFVTELRGLSRER